MSRVRPAGWLFLGLFFASLAVAAAGLQRLLAVEQGLQSGLAAAEEAFLPPAEPNEVTFRLARDPAPVPTPRVTRTGVRAAEGEAIAVLTFHFKRDAKVAVFDGTGDRALEQGAGRTVSSALPNETGRCILHGHRDSAFAPLARAAVGDEVSVATPEETVRYRIAETFVTTPDDPAIYATAEHRQLVLVTCHPFTFVGPAPNRFVAVCEEAAKENS